MKRITILLSLVAFFAVSCENSELESCYCEGRFDKNVIISETEYENAPYSHVEIIDAKIVNNYLNIEFSASGCDGISWNVELIGLGNYDKSNPPQTTLRLSLDNKETCNAIITRDASFNLEPLIEYFQHHGTSKIYLNISGYRILFTYFEQEQVFNLLDLTEGSWIHSWEEDDENSCSIYRPSDYKEFPPSRFRQYFEFKENNVCSYLVLSPDDAHYIQDGVWEYDESTNIITIMSETDVIFEFQIIELDKNMLKLRML